MGKITWVYDGEKFVDGVYRVECGECNHVIFDADVCPRCHAPGGLERALHAGNRWPVPTACPMCAEEEVIYRALLPARVAYEGRRADKARTATEPHDEGFHGYRVDCRGLRHGVGAHRQLSAVQRARATARAARVAARLQRSFLDAVGGRHRQQHGIGQLGEAGDLREAALAEHRAPGGGAAMELAKEVAVAVGARGAEGPAGRSDRGAEQDRARVGVAVPPEAPRYSRTPLKPSASIRPLCAGLRTAGATALRRQS